MRVESSRVGVGLGRVGQAAWFDLRLREALAAMLGATLLPLPRLPSCVVATTSNQPCFSAAPPSAYSPNWQALAGSAAVAQGPSGLSGLPPGPDALSHPLICGTTGS